MRPDLSIVILVYKTAHLLRRCLDSLVCSDGYDPANVEIVVVSDASPDACDAVMADYKGQHSEIVYAKRERNGGEAAARNSGLERCSGRYYTYVDSDDTVTPEYLTKIRAAIREDSPDVLTYQYQLCDEKGRHLSGRKGEFEGVCSLDDGVQARRRIFARFAMALRCNAVIRSDLVKDVRYAEGCRLGEDALFAFEAFLRAEKFGWIPDVLYNYYQYATSATHNFDEGRICDLLKIHGYYLDKIGGWPHKSEVADLVYGFFNMNYLSWILDEVVRFGASSAAADALRATYNRVVDTAFADGVIGRMRFAFMKSVIARPNVADWAVLKKVYWCETQVRRVRNLVRRVFHV